MNRSGSETNRKRLPVLLTQRIGLNAGRRKSSKAATADVPAVTELKTPLATILLHAEAALELLDRGARSPRARAALRGRIRAIIRQTFRGSQMVQELVESAQRGRAEARF